MMRHIVQVIQLGSASTGGYTALVLDNEGNVWAGRETPISDHVDAKREFRWERVKFPPLPLEAA
jgi:hypothetical protein